MIINLGCGKKIIEGAVNIDVMHYEGVDHVTDLSVFPWPLGTGSVDGIHASHILEHFQDQKQFLEECYRILKPGGFLRIVAPHSSCVTSIGCLGHYRTYSYDTFNDYLAKPYYMFKTKRFETTYQKLSWWHEEIDAEGKVPGWARAIIMVVNPIMDLMISLITPRIFENVFCPGIQCREVIWEGKKI